MAICHIRQSTDWTLSTQAKDSTRNRLFCKCLLVSPSHSFGMTKDYSKSSICLHSIN